MQTDEILSIEISLLLIKYGERKVLKSLSELIGIDIKDLLTNIHKVTQFEKKHIVKKKMQTSQTVDEIIDQNPNNVHLLKVLYARYQNKSFLPELRDIKRLLNRHSIETEGVKSRNSAAVKVFKVLASLDNKELEELTQQQDRANFSSLGIISDQILGRKE